MVFSTADIRKGFRRFHFALLWCASFSVSSFAAFIQEPIPPSASQNYFEDRNFDGKMDYAKIAFLGNLSPEYIDSALQSVTLYWPDSAGNSQAFLFSPKEIVQDSENANSILLDFSQKTGILLERTDLDAKSRYAEILYTDSTRVKALMRESLPPHIFQATLRSHAHGKDSLLVRFTEDVFENDSHKEILQFKRADAIQALPATAKWLNNRTLVLWNEIPNGDFPRVGDSLRIRPGALRDSLQNSVPETSPFALISGLSSIQLYTNSLSIPEESEALRNVPIFERIFSDTTEIHPNAQELGVALKLGGNEFRHFIQESVLLDSVFAENIAISIFLQIYTTQGEYVTGVHSETRCNDTRFLGGDCLQKQQILFLKWNLLASNRRKAATGAYLIKYSSSIRHQDKILWRSDNGKNSSAVWGIKRKSQ